MLWKWLSWVDNNSNNSCCYSWTCRQSICLQLHADGAIKWKMTDQSPLCVKRVDNHNNIYSWPKEKDTIFGAVYTEEQRLNEANILWSVELYVKSSIPALTRHLPSRLRSWRFKCWPFVVTCRLDYEADVSSMSPSSDACFSLRKGQCSKQKLFATKFYVLASTATRQGISN